MRCIAGEAGAGAGAEALPSHDRLLFYTLPPDYLKHRYNKVKIEGKERGETSITLLRLEVGLYTT